MRILVQSALCLTLLVPSAASSADTLLAPGGKPGVITRVDTKGESVVLKVKNGFSPEDVANTVTHGVPGARCKVERDSVMVSGVSKADLLPALERLEVSPQLDDIDAMLSNMQGLGTEDEGSGSSIRATKVAELGEADGKKLPRVVATVLAVRHQRYPLVALRVKVSDAGGLEGLSAGKEIEVVPLIARGKGDKSVEISQSRKNARAWYARPGDEIVVELKARGDKDVFVAQSYERRPRTR